MLDYMGLATKIHFSFNNEIVTAYFCFSRNRLTYSEQNGDHLGFFCNEKSTDIIYDHLDELLVL